MIDTLKLEEALQSMTWADKPYNAAYESPHYVRASARPSYMRRHWRGELSLARSYWINTVLVSAILKWMTVGLGHGIDVTQHARVFALWHIALWLGLAGVTVWQ